MSDRFQVNNTLYPILSIAVVLFTFIGALAMARSIWGVIFLAAVFVLLCLFGYARTCIRLLPFLAIYLGIFSLIFYLASQRNLPFTVQMAIRLGGVVIAVIPGLSLPPVKLVRNLTGLHCPRLVTLGLLITMSFVPVLAGEIRQVKSAMRTRGVTSVLNPTLFYRAFLIPLIVRLVNISDTLALSVETRGFVSEEDNFTVFHPVTLTGKDIAFGILFFICLIGGIVLTILGVTF